MNSEEFWNRLERRESGCWEYPVRTTRGYGRIKVNGKATHAHRLAYQLSYGPIPAGMVVCHSCDNPPCCNPAHLWLGTQKENLVDMANKGRSTRGRPWITKAGVQVAAKLTAANVQTIRDRYASGQVTQQQLASEFNVHKKTISRIIRRIRWKHI